MNKQIKIELLAPAKNLEYGKEAIRCGADAVYIGASKFGARYAAGNSIEEIAELVDFAHSYSARVYVTLNTLLYEDELEEARKQALELCGVGVDAFIVQDMAYLMFDLPIQLHASTQTASYDLERVKFLESVGFDRVVVERALSGEQLKEICKETKVEIEAFVHGAICVSYSGVCYMGHIVSNRSGNRGVCSQACRSTYNLYDDSGKMVISQKHLLSVKDLKLSQHIGDMIDNGVKSFKIEGRLKDISYLKNSVIHYRKEIDKYLSKNDNYCRSSDGDSVCSMEIELNKSFTRGFSDYFYKGKTENVGTFNTGKAIGEYMGQVIEKGRDFVKLDTPQTFGNGDGICFVGKHGEFTGTNINTSNGDKIFPNRLDDIDVNTKIYRNFDTKYSSAIEKEKVDRRISVDIRIEFCDDKIVLSVNDAYGVSAEKVYSNEGFDGVRNIDKMTSTLIEQLKKSGDTIFKIDHVSLDGELLFVPVSVINLWRRELLDDLKLTRIKKHSVLTHTKRVIPKTEQECLSYKANVTNSLSKQFYKECGYSNVEDGIEIQTGSYVGCEAMTMKYCLRGEIGECLKKGSKKGRLFLENNNNYFELIPNCDKCEMKLIYRGRNYFNRK